MAKCHPKDGGSLVLNRMPGGNLRIWTSFSGAALRRKIFDTVRCGGTRHRRRESGVSTIVESMERKSTETLTDQKQRSQKLAVLLRLSDSPENAVDASEVDIKKRTEALEELKRVVKRLQLDAHDEQKKVAAGDVRRLAKEDAEARTTLAMLGAIPPLIQMLDSGDIDSQIASLYALLNLGIGNDANKAAIVRAGTVHKMLKLMESQKEYPNPCVCDAIVANFLGLSALDLNKPIIGSSGAIPFIVETLKNIDNRSSYQAKQDSIRALYNISICPSNVSVILETDLIPFLLNTLGDMEVSERVLSILSNIVSTPEGRKAISQVPDSIPILMDVLNWTDSPGCQEKASYVLMVMAHKAYGDRLAMIENGIVSSLLELMLIGSTLAQKRASRILETLRTDKGKQVSCSFNGGLGAAVSAPLYGSSSSADQNQDSKDCLDEEDMMSEERKAVNQLVQQSLQSNMRRIVKRANLPQDFVPSDHFKSLALSSTSKSLPF